ncbi:3'(2'),5'-bisphosphate nucleotidase [Salinibacter sp. 10B]|uniref:3'(2'),5'-bisphosphate nucleotidase n=1 Tax=Salinibacter sp. 10B TaxID=1923971 RepID=UPI000CF4382D|nr:3'(2'),5'-bisphosphate nucleotidase [Salinibacter sp. 10B]PQJ33836.1 3'(2'),5'-bisphosphate nucleotidase [Salinibacter sp. 10B]
MSESYEQERTVAFEAVQAAATLTESVRESMGEVLKKDDRSPVTVADFGSQALICRALMETFPQDPVIAEEDSSALRNPDNTDVRDQVLEHVQAHHEAATPEGVYAWIDHGTAREYSDRFWTLDPIDGTKGFVRGDQYAIALALIENGIPQVAALCCPHLPPDLADDDPDTRGQAFLAVRGEGTLQRSLNQDTEPTPIHTSNTTEPSQSRFTESFVSSHSSHDLAVEVAERLGITADPFRLDSQAKYAAVATGNADIYLRLPRPGTDYTERIWDHAAGALVVEAAGGTVTDMHGSPLDFTHGRLLKQNTGIVATNGAVHQDVIDALEASTS